MVSPSYSQKRVLKYDKYNILEIPLLNNTIGKFLLLKVFMHIFLKSLTDAKNFAAALSYYAAHGIDVCPFKNA